MKRLPSLLAVGVIGVLVSSPLPASAHASLASSNPADKSQVATMPDEVSFTLTEPVRKPALISVMSEDGTKVNSEAVTVRDDTATTAINGPVEAGDYTMNYKIISVDGHTVTGKVGFEVLNGSAPTPSSTPTTAPQPTTAPSPATAPTDTPASGQTMAATTTDDSSSYTDALTIVGFSVITMTGLILVLRAGLRSAASEDED